MSLHTWESWLASHYEIRMLDLQSLRQTYMPAIEQNANMFWGNKSKIWQCELDGCFEWMIEEALSKVLSCRVEGHFHYDFGKCAYQMFPDFEKHLSVFLETTNFIERKGRIKHAKLMVLGNMLILAVLVL